MVMFVCAIGLHTLYPYRDIPMKRSRGSIGRTFAEKAGKFIAAISTTSPPESAVGFTC